MKKIILILLLSPFTLIAQRQDYLLTHLRQINYNVLSGHENTYLNIELPEKVRKDNGVKSCVTYIVKKDKKRFIEENTFNRHGKHVSRRTEKGHKQMTYKNDTLLKEVLGEYRRSTNRHVRNYSEDKLMSMQNYTNGKLKSGYELSYSNDKIVRNRYTEGRRSFELVNKYEDDQIAETKYLVNGKMKKHWVYDCKPEGKEVIDRSKEMSNFCQYREEANDGSYIKYTRTVEKGIPFLLKAYFTSDSVFFKFEKFESDSILTIRNTVSDEIRSYEVYKKGKYDHGYVQQLDREGRIVKSRSFRGKKQKFVSGADYTYNEKGLVTEVKRSNNRKVYYHKSFKYFFFE